MSKKSSGGGNLSGRSLHVKVKTAKRRKLGSTLWLQRQLNDPYVAQAKKDGYRSRAAYKLIEMDEKHKFLTPGARIVDLGAAPGGWCQIAAQRVGSTDEDIRVVGIDYLGMDPMPGVTILQKDFLDDDAPDMLMEALRGHKADIVMSDMAAPTTGHRKTDHLRTTHLFEVAADFARNALVPGGLFLSKVFRGGTEHELLQELKREYKSVAHIKPPASRKESPELYVLAKGFRGAEDDED
ncbi:RlmE family RNA methyltransferase [Coralliovum pocilloporae]|uniref:RlmE family RNA methyltransferase n=1 Tax=Coralliovum pocilloporae TaxID=3066369 RepID=UPI00330754AB